MKKFRYFLEACLLWSAFSIFRMMSAPSASNLGGWIGRKVGPRLAASRKALNNMKHALPNKTDSEYAAIITGMWDNLGRIFAEYPHLDKIVTQYTEIVGKEHLQAIGADNPCIFIGGHIGNWEVVPYYFNHNSEWPVSAIYRAPNNPYAERLLDKCRGRNSSGSLIPKSIGGTRAMVQTIRNSGRVAILIDQKYNEGIAVPFLGYPAMTSTAFAQLAKKYDCPIVPLQVERLSGCNFRIIVHTPFIIENCNEEEAVVKAHSYLEHWIQQNPAQWLWLHRRWNSKALEHRF